MSLQKNIISYLGVKPFINPKTEFKICVNFIKKYLKKHYFIESLVLGISGGQDSTLAGIMCRKAINELHDEHLNNNLKLIGVRLPFGRQKDEKDCYSAISFIQPDKVFNINIKSSIKINEYNLLKIGVTLHKNFQINAKSRERMKMLYSIAKSNNGIVIGTSNSAELITGYFTKYGDGGTDINPLFHLNKRQGKKILKYLNCPETLYLKHPTADTGEDCSTLIDELELGISYEDIDDYLEGKKINLVLSRKIESLFMQSQHKRSLPINIFNDY